jgi:hypothetical protein
VGVGRWAQPTVNKANIMITVILRTVFTSNRESPLHYTSRSVLQIQQDGILMRNQSRAKLTE